MQVLSLWDCMLATVYASKSRKLLAAMARSALEFGPIRDVRSNPDKASRRRWLESLESSLEALEHGDDVLLALDWHRMCNYVSSPPFCIALLPPHCRPIRRCHVLVGKHCLFLLGHTCTVVLTLHAVGASTVCPQACCWQMQPPEPWCVNMNMCHSGHPLQHVKCTTKAQARLPQGMVLHCVEA